ncbi:MAG: hydrogenase maturation nickel metallochaperone HypA [Magnetococcales bacterium]|nr:hydrogenase maturation nickel metallochaperone HypA [Magnetococcales bacterium]
MHELNIAMALVEQIREFMVKENAHELISATVAVGALSGVEADALAFCFPLAIEGTPMQGAQLHLEPVPVRLRCRSCEAKSQPEESHMLHCVVCGSGQVEIVTGHDLILQSLEVS